MIVLRSTASVLLLVALCQSPVPQTQAPVFKGRLDLIRTEVSVIANKTGEPVTGLQQSDFTVSENGKPRDIASFVGMDPVGASTADPLKRRVFLIVFGGGYLPGPVKPFDGAIQFLRERALPTDLVAIMVWNRVTMLTTDHERLAALVDRIRRLPEDVFVSTYRDILKLRDVTPETQAAIDKWLDPLEGSDGFLRSATALLFDTSLYQREANDGWPWSRRLASHDLLKVFAGIEYLRRVEGQKHLVLLSRHGLHAVTPFDPTGFLHSAEDDHALAVHANDAGVALDIIHTYGTGQSDFQIQSSQQVARESGGQFTSVRTAAQGLMRIDAATRAGYLIAFAPANPELDGRYRNVDIRVNRKDVTVVFRHGYTASPDPQPTDPREAMARIRLLQAAASPVMLDDLRVTGTARAAYAGDVREVRVEVTLDTSKMLLSRIRGRWTGSVDLLLLCEDARSNVVGTVSKHFDLDMSPAEFEAAKLGGLGYQIAIPVRTGAWRVRVIAYNYETDRLGAWYLNVR